MNFSNKFLLIFISILFLISFTSAGFFQLKKTCGDGTLEGECSLMQPYFCSQKTLIEKSSICGCSNLTEVAGDSCVLEYQTNSKEVNLKYVLRGQENQINFIVYGGMDEYLSSLPNFISYSFGEEPQRADFKLKNINEEKQRELLLPLVVEIQNIAKSKEDQARIAISLVQNIPFGGSDEKLSVGNGEINVSRYPYQVLYDVEGVCGEKSELLTFLLREIGYEVVLFYHKIENHESVGISCPEKYGLGNTSYCFIETTGPSIITNNQNKYLGGIELSSDPEIILISEGDSLENRMYEYKDAKRLIKINQLIEDKGKINIIRYMKLRKLQRKYGLNGY